MKLVKAKKALALQQSNPADFTSKSDVIPKAPYKRGFFYARVIDYHAHFKMSVKSSHNIMFCPTRFENQKNLIIKRGLKGLLWILLAIFRTNDLIHPFKIAA